MNDTRLWRPLAKENVSDPYGMYKVLRERDPVHLSQTGEYIVTRYDHVKQVLKSQSFQSGNRLIWLKKGIEYFHNKEEDLRAIYRAMNSFILMLNDEQHHRIRSFVSNTWHDRQVDTVIESNIDMLLDRIDGAHVDFVSEYAQPLPVYTISRILGIEITDCQRLIGLAIAMTKALDLYVSLKDLVQLNRAAAEFVMFFQQLIEEKTNKPDDALFSNMIARNKSDNVGLSDEELASIGIFLFTAGVETSASLISNSMLNLLRHPVQLAQVRANPHLLESAIEEVLRYDSVVHLLGRVAHESTTLGDKEIPQGATVTLVVASANRDEDVFEKPDEFIVTRKPNRHLSFGSGAHYCLGDWLGRRQSQFAIRRFLERYPRIALQEQDLTWNSNLAVRRLNHLHLAMGS